MPLQLDYYYGMEAEQYSFYRIPKLLFTDPRFIDVSVEAKVLYGLLLDRMALSVKNGWLDGQGRVYIIFTIAEMMKTLGCAEQKANKLLCELDSARGIGLIERKRRGLGKPNVIYVKNFADKNIVPPGAHEPFETAEPGKAQFQICENHNFGNVNCEDQEMRNSQSNYTDLINTDLKETRDKSILPDRSENIVRFSSGEVEAQEPDRQDNMDTYRKLIQENISYEILLIEKPHDKGRIDGFVELMAEICCSTRKTIRINQDNIPLKEVRSRFLQLDSSHIRYVLDCMDRNCELIGNVRLYILSALFNAPVTIDEYYSNLVRYDMAHGINGG